MLSLFGLSADQQAQREVSELNNKNTGFTDWDLGDMFRSAITGVSKDDVLKRAQGIVSDRINENNTTLIGDARRSLASGGLESNNGLRYKPGQTEAQFQDSLNDDLVRGSAATALRGSEHFTGTIDPSASSGALLDLASQTKRDATSQKKADEAALRLEQRNFTREQTNMQLQAGRDQYNHSFRTQEARLAHQDKQNRLDRALERELSNNNSDMQMRIKLMDLDLADKRMAYDREMRAKDKRAAMIAQLMKGIAGLGAAFG